MFGPGGLGLEGANLTDAQRDTVKGIVDSHREEMQALFERVTAARRALSASADAGRVDDSQAAEVGSATAALALAEAKVRAEVLQLLTPEQRAEITRRAAERELRFAERTRRGRQ
jgi:Spy/CpxP family protein refolding chaperone